MHSKLYTNVKCIGTSGSPRIYNVHEHATLFITFFFFYVSPSPWLKKTYRRKKKKSCIRANKLNSVTRSVNWAQPVLFSSSVLLKLLLRQSIVHLCVVSFTRVGIHRKATVVCVCVFSYNMVFHKDVANYAKTPTRTILLKSGLYLKHFTSRSRRQYRSCCQQNISF